MKNLTLIPSNKSSINSGGTADMLPNERKKASFNVDTMINILDGGKKSSARKKLIKSTIKNLDYSDRYYSSRPELFKNHIKEYIRIHKSFPNFVPTKEDLRFMTTLASVGGTSLGNHSLLFLMTLANNCDDKQLKAWFTRAMKFEIVGCYAQTELGHGSNVRGLETLAVYDNQTDEFVLNTPTLTSRKFWPGALAKVSTHACVYAQLVIGDKNYGLHVFFLQIRFFFSFYLIFVL